MGWTLLMRFSKLELLMRAALLCFVFIAVGCKERNPNYCPENPDNVCTTIDAPERCSATMACTTGVCNEQSGICVQCLQNTDCSANKPICNLQINTCQACTAHSQCTASNVCLPSGECGTEANVAYLAPNGTDNAVCSIAQKCTVFSKALATTKPFIKVEGSYTEAVAVDRTVTILGDPGAKFAKTSGTIVEAKGAAQIAIYDVEITGGGNQTIGVSIPTGQTTALTLDRVTVSKNGMGGIIAASGALNVLNSRIDSNLGGGIQLTGAGTRYSIVNSFIIYNGLDTGVQASPFGAAELSGNQAGNKFEFNTVAFNKSDGNRAAGLDCGGVMSTVHANIIYANQEPTNGTGELAQKRGTCSYQTTNFVSGTNVGGAADLGFQSPRVVPFSFKLTASSPAQVLDVIKPPGMCPATDFEGQPRPEGMGCDLGADELKP
jgi:hypothetical protein